MEIRPLTPADEPLWDEFCAENSGAWFWQTMAYLKCMEIYRPSAETKPRHFLVFRGKQPIGICPLAIEKRVRDGQPASAFSLGEDYIPGPVIADSLAQSDRERVLRAVLEEVDRQANESGITWVGFRESALNPRILTPSVSPVNDFTQFNFLDASLQTQVLDLRQPEEALWSGMRRSYHSPIHRAEEAFQFRLLDRATVTDDNFRLYRELHHKDAGRVTRPLETFQQMLGWIRSGHGILGQILRGEQVLACALLVLYKTGAYYLSACTDPEFADPKALGPFLQWKLIQNLKRLGVSYYELGWQLRSPQLSHIPSDKEKHIAFFKRGFGGLAVPLFRGEKYYSSEAFLSDYGQRIKSIDAHTRNRETVS